MSDWHEHMAGLPDGGSTQSKGGIRLEWVGEDAVRRRVIMEPRDAGGYKRITQRHNGSEWVREGAEIVSDVGLDAPAAVVRSGSSIIG